MIVHAKNSHTKQAAILEGNSVVPVYIDDRDLDFGVTDFVLDEGEKFKICPSDIKDQKDYVIIAGKSGCGKSTAASVFIQSYHMMFPTNKIYVFSVKEKDEKLDKFPYIIRVKMNEIENFIGKEKTDKKKKVISKPKPKKKKRKIDEDGIKLETKTDEEDEGVEIDEYVLEDDPNEIKSKTPEELKNSLLVFDDIEHSGKLHDRLYEFKAKMIQVGRSYNINVIWCVHLQLNGQSTKEDINEATSLIFFPKSANAHHYIRHLEEYVGLKKRDIKRILDKKNHWVCINLHHPVSILTETELWIIQTTEEDVYEEIYNKKRKK